MKILEQGEKHFVLINRTADSLFSLIADGQNRDTTLGRETWKSLLGSKGSLQLNFNMECFNVFGGSCGAKARIGIIANNEIGCGSCPDSTIGFVIGGDLAVSNSKQIMTAGIRKLWDISLCSDLGVEGPSKNFLYVEALPQGPTPYPFMHHFSRKRYPFPIPSIDKWYPFHIPC